MRHQDLTLNHRLETWVYANAAARMSATGFVSGDIGRIAFQTDTGQYWRLTATAPTWQAASPSLVLAYASLHATGTTPPGISGSTVKMLGLGSAAWGSAVITPTATGKLFAVVSGTVYNTVASQPTGLQLRYGTGTPPVNGAASAGNNLALTQNYLHSASVGDKKGFSTNGVLTALLVGTAYWFDLAFFSTASGGVAIENVTTDVVELP